MNVNLTLLIQALHFLITYYFISKFLLKPVLKVLRDEISAKAFLRQQVATEQEKLENKEQNQKEQWQEDLYYFKNHLPDTNIVARIEYPEKLVLKSFKELDKKTLVTITNDTVKVLKSKIVCAGIL